MINVFKPNLWQEEINAVTEVLKSWWVAMWPKVSEFENNFSAYLWWEHYSLAMNSATAALHLAFAVLWIEKKEVITTAMTFVSTNHAILYSQWIPVFTDIERNTLNIDPNEIEKNITKNTKAIIVVHYGWHACDMDAIMTIAKKYNLYVIEDCAHAAWWEYKGKKLWTIGDIGTFSFHGVKNMTTWDGWMLVTKNKEWYEKIKKLRWVWMDKDTFDRENSNSYSWYYNIDCLWYKYHMNDINAAIWIEQLKKLDQMNKRRREITEIYNKELSDLKWIELPIMKDYSNNANHNYVIKTSYRNELNSYLSNFDISTWVHYIPNNHYEMYKSFGNNTPITEEVWTKLLTLPLYPTLTNEEVYFVVEKIKSFII